MLDLATQLKVSILLYEYSGYGASTGKSSEKSLENNIKAAYDYLKKETPWHKIVLLGSSIGSYPSCKLASQVPIAGLILLSPLASGLSLICEDIKKTHSRDVFNNLALVSIIKCPVFVIHGKRDKIVPFSHAEALISAMKNPYPPFFIDRGGHTGIEVRYRKQFLFRISEFLTDLTNFQQEFCNLNSLELLLSPSNLKSEAIDILCQSTDRKFVDSIENSADFINNHN